jgi:hypothetical protein
MKQNSVGWFIQKETIININVYEHHRPPRRERLEMQMPSEVRQEVLMNEWEVPFSTIRETTLLVSQDRQNRLKTQQKFEKKKKRLDFRKLFCRGLGCVVKNSKGELSSSVLSSSTQESSPSISESSPSISELKSAMKKSQPRETFVPEDTEIQDELDINCERTFILGSHHSVEISKIIMQSEEQKCDDIPISTLASISQEENPEDENSSSTSICSNHASVNGDSPLYIPPPIEQQSKIETSSDFADMKSRDSGEESNCDASEDKGSNTKTCAKDDNHSCSSSSPANEESLAQETASQLPKECIEDTTSGISTSEVLVQTDCLEDDNDNHSSCSSLETESLPDLIHMNMDLQSVTVSLPPNKHTIDTPSVFAIESNESAQGDLNDVPEEEASISTNPSPQLPIELEQEQIET